MHFFNFDHLKITLQSSDLIWSTKFCAPSPSTHLFLPSSSYPWLPMMMSLFLTHLLLELTSPIIFLPSPFRCNWSSRRKGLHWWRRSKAYRLHMKLHQYLSALSEESWIWSWISGLNHRWNSLIIISEILPPNLAPQIQIQIQVKFE